MDGDQIYSIIRDTLTIITKVYNRMEASGLENVPAAGGALLCPNHSNYSDPFFVGAAVRTRKLHFLAWHGVEEMPILGPIFAKTGVLHSIRESYGVALDKEQAREVLGGLTEILRAGELCVMFPEGAIKHWIGSSGEIKDFKPGAVRMAAQAGVPIIPVALSGTRWVVPNLINFHDFGGPDKAITLPLVLPSKVRVLFGEPFHPDPAAATDAAARDSETARLRETIIKMVDEIS